VTVALLGFETNIVRRPTRIPATTELFGETCGSLSNITLNFFPHLK